MGLYTDDLHTQSEGTRQTTPVSLDGGGGWSVFESSNSFSLSLSNGEVGGIVKQLPGDLLFAGDTSSLLVIPYPQLVVCPPSPFLPK